MNVGRPRCWYQYIAAPQLAIHVHQLAGHFWLGRIKIKNTALGSGTSTRDAESLCVRGRRVFAIVHRPTVLTGRTVVGGGVMVFSQWDKMRNDLALNHETCGSHSQSPNFSQNSFILTVEQLLVAFSNQCTYHPIPSPPHPFPIHKQSLCSKPIICTPCIGCPGFNHEIKLWRTWQKYWYILFALAARLSYILKPSKTINKWPLYTCNWMTTRKL